MTNDADYLTRPESCRKAADKSTLLPFSWPQYQQLEGMCKLTIVLLSLWGLMHKIYPTSRY